MKKVAVLGANGQLGKTIKTFSNDVEIEFYFFSRNDIDITNKSSLIAVFNYSDFDYCINCAAYTNVEGAETNTEETFLINAEGVKHIAEVCDTHRVKLIQISTDYVFDGKKEEPYTTFDEVNPINQYGKSKLKGEHYIQEHLKEYYIVRTSWLYSLHGRNFFKTVITKIENDEVLKITTAEEGTPTSCLDLAEFIIHIIKTDALSYGIYNFSANGSTTWYGFAQEIVRNFNPQKLDSILPIENFKTLAMRPQYSVLNLEKTEKNYRELSHWEKNVSVLVENYNSFIK